MLKNDTDHNVKVTLQPNPEADGVQYELELSVEHPEDDIYHVDLPDYDPRTLLSDGYSHFVVEIDNADRDRISFGKDLVPAYQLDPYADLSGWELEEFHFTYHFNYSSRKTLVHEFTFNISEDLIVK